MDRGPECLARGHSGSLARQGPFQGAPSPRGRGGMEPGVAVTLHAGASRADSSCPDVLLFGGEPPASQILFPQGAVLEGRFLFFWVNDVKPQKLLQKVLGVLFSKSEKPSPCRGGNQWDVDLAPGVIFLSIGSRLPCGLPRWRGGKEPARRAGDAAGAGSVPDSGRCPGGGVATPSGIHAWRLPWTEGPGRRPTGSLWTRLSPPAMPGLLVASKIP